MQTVAILYRRPDAAAIAGADPAHAAGRGLRYTDGRCLAGCGDHRLDAPVEIPENLLVEVRADGAPVAGAFVQPVFAARHRNDFTLCPKLTDGCGEARWTCDEMRAWIEESRALFPQDFGEFDRHAAGLLRVEILGRRDIEWAERAIDWIGERGRWPETYRATLTEARRIVERLESLPIEVDVRCEAAGEGEVWRCESRVLAGFVHGPSPERMLLADVPGYTLPGAAESSDT